MADLILKLLLTVSAITSICQSQPQVTQPPPDLDRSKVQQVYRYRLVNWCIIGQGEHPLYQWPLNQLKPYLLNTQKSTREFQENKFDKTKVAVREPKSLQLEFNKIQCSETADVIGDGIGNYVQRIHLKFKSDVHVQGLVIQAVHQPFGLGFPFGQFDVDGEFKCNDCQFDFSTVIGCISRPDVEMMHPTVGAFHYKRKKYNKTTDARAEVGAQKELHWNFKWADSECSSAKAVEFWVLIIFDFDYRVWMVKKFGPYDFSSKSKFQIISGLLPPIVQPRFPSPIFPSCNPLPPEFEVILAESGKGLPRSCFKEFGVDYNATRCWLWKEKKTQEYMVDHPDYMTSKITCDVGPAYTLQDNTKIWTPARVIGDFDLKCITRFNRESKDRIRQPYKICSHWQGRFYCDANDATLNALNQPSSLGNPDKDRYFPSSICEPCVKVTEAPLPPLKEGPGFIKRGVHGGMMSFAFFFFLPVSITICRFYKETLHSNEIKGWRIWLMAHVGMAIFVVFLSYISYTLPSFLDLDIHMYLGYAALFCCAGGLASGWFRHKSEWVITLSFYIHSFSGYSGWGLAIGSMVMAPGIGAMARLLCYFASGFSLAAMAVLTCHICIKDRDMEMSPVRSHIPILQIRFDDLFPPGHRFRKKFLFVYVGVQFLVCCGMMTL